MPQAASPTFEIFCGVAETVYSIKPDTLTLRTRALINSNCLMYGKSGENPPLPRNCNRRELSVVATRGCYLGRLLNSSWTRESGDRSDPDLFGLLRIRWESRTA